MLAQLQPDETVRVENVGKRFCRDLKRSLWYGACDVGRELAPWTSRGAPDLRPGEFQALAGVSLQVRRGECLGLIGPNGAGKTTLLRLINGLIKPDAGTIAVRGRVGALIALGAGFNPVLSGRENIHVNAAILGLRKAEIAARLDAIIAFADIGTALDAPVQTYSSGMQVRLGYSVVANLQPDVLLVDEVLAVGDAAFQRQCMAHMKQYLAAGGSAILVAHNMHAIQSLCTHCAVLDQGRLQYSGPASVGISRYYALQQAVRATGVMRGRPEQAADVVIERVEIVGPSEGELHGGEPAEVRLHYRAQRAIAGVAWGFSIWSNAQQVRLGTATSSWDGVTCDLAAGRGRLTALIPELPLVGGSYHLKAGIYDGQTSWALASLGWDDAPLPVVVIPKVTEAENRRIASGDLVVFRTLWQ
jgi:lipopolysaccharide transport system ATP-binding protein